MHLSAAGFYKTPKLHWDRDKGKGRPFFYYAYGAACSEVAIDILTGEMNVRRVDILHDVGRSINPALDIGQIEGAFVQGMGWLTTEELVYDDKGRLLTHAPSTYKIPVASDVPADFRVALFDGSNREETIYRSKAVGEPPLMLGISVFAAIADAIHSVHPGKPVALDAPATPEAILKALGPVDAVAALAPLMSRVAQRLKQAVKWRRSGPAFGKPSNGTALPVCSAWLAPPARCRARPAPASSCSRTAAFTAASAAAGWNTRRSPRRVRLWRGGRGAAQFRDWPLGPNLGQCCGGMVKTLTETFDRDDLAAVRRLEEAEKAGAFVTASRVDDDGTDCPRPLAPPSAAGPAWRWRLRHSPRRRSREHFGEVTDPGAAVRRRPCRPRRGAGAGAAAFHRALDRQPAGSVSATRAAERRHRPHRSRRPRIGRSAARRAGCRHDPLASRSTSISPLRHCGGAISISSA